MGHVEDSALMGNEPRVIRGIGGVALERDKSFLLYSIVICEKRLSLADITQFLFSVGYFVEIYDLTLNLNLVFLVNKYAMASFWITSVIMILSTT